MFKVYGKSNCKSCKDTQDFLKKEMLEYNYLSLGSDYSLDKLLDFNPQHRSMPMVTVVDLNGDEKYVGTFEDLKAILK